MMKRKKIVVPVIALSLTAFSVFAQPSEELQVITIDEMSEEEKRLFLPDQNIDVPVQNVPVQVEQNKIVSPSPVVNQQVVPQPVSPVPVAVPQAVAPSNQALNNQGIQPMPVAVHPMPVGGVIDVTPAAPEKPQEPVDGTISGLNFNAGIGLRPLGVVNFAGRDNTTYYALTPSFGLSTKFATERRNAVDFNLGYSGIYRGYYNRADIKRDYNHTVEAGINGKVNDQWTYGLNGMADWIMVSGGPDEGENFLYIAGTPTVGMKIHDGLKLSFNYHVEYFQFLDVSIGVVDSFGGDFDTDVFAGTLFSDAVFGANNSDDSLGAFGFSNEKVDKAWIENKLGFKSVWSPSKSTTLTFDYRYAFRVISNDPNIEWKGHLLRPKISQTMPWDGGKLTYELRFRYRKRDTKLTSAGDRFAADMRFRNRLAFSQKIIDNVNATLWYQHQTTMSNDDNYSKKGFANEMFLGVNYTF